MKDWFYKLSKDELFVRVESLGLCTDGSLDDLRRRLKRHIDTHPEYYQDIESENVAAAAPEIRITPEINMPAPDTINQMRKWGINFDGKDPWAFLERIEELQLAYDFPKNL